MNKTLNVIGFRVGLLALFIAILLARWGLIAVNAGLVVLNKMILGANNKGEDCL